MSERKFNGKRNKKNFDDGRRQEAEQEEKSTKMPLIMVQAKDDKANTEATDSVQAEEWTEVKLQPASRWRMFHRMNEPSLDDLRTILAKECPALSIGDPTGRDEGYVIRSHKLKGGMLRAHRTPTKKRRKTQPPSQRQKKQKTKSRTKKVPAEGASDSKVVSSSGTPMKGDPKTSLFHTPTDKEQERFQAWLDNAAALEKKIAQYRASKTSENTSAVGESLEEEDLPVVSASESSSDGESEEEETKQPTSDGWGQLREMF
jgi:hypothetical protein